MLITYLPYLYLFAQLLAGELVFLSKTERRPYYAARLVPTAVICGVGMYFLVYMPYIGFWIYLIPLLVSAGIVWLCYDINPLHAMVFAVIAYALQNCSFDITIVVFGLFGRPNMQAVELVALGVLAGLLVASWFLFVRKGRITDVLGIKNIKLAAVCVAVLTAVIVLHSYFNVRTAELIGRVFLILSIVLSLFLLFGISGRESLAREKEEIEQMLRREEMLHRISKENIDLINVKCHDLKHRLRAGRGALTDEEIKEIEGAVALYDGFVKTGNPDLDIVIAENSLRCRKSGITISCIADGSALGFMLPGDIYALFGNALDNAIEYLENVDKDKRIIDLTVRRRDDIVGITVENYCAQPSVFSDGLPVTSKKDRNYHGFGMKSMRYIAEKYGGSLIVSQENEKFVLAIVLSMRSVKSA